MSTLALLFGSGILLLIGVPGNSLIILSYVVVKRLRTQQSVFIVSLAITDLILITYLLPFNMVFTIIGANAISRQLCIFNAFVAHVCFTSGVQTIMHVAINRYVKICLSITQYIKIYTKRNIIFILISNWLMGPLFSLPLWKNRELYFVYDSSLRMCIFNRYGDKVYDIIYMVACLLIPIAITTLCYFRIQRQVTISQKQMARHWNNGLARQRAFNDMRSTKSQFLIFVAYLILYLPFGAITLFTSSVGDVPINIHVMSIMLCYVNSCINCLIYGALNTNMRRGYKEALSCFKQNAETNSSIRETAIDSNKRVHPEPFVNVKLTVGSKTCTSNQETYI